MKSIGFIRDAPGHYSDKNSRKNGEYDLNSLVVKK